MVCVSAVFDLWYLTSKYRCTCTIASLSKSTIAGASSNKTEKQNFQCMHKYARVCKGKLKSAQGF